MSLPDASGSKARLVHHSTSRGQGSASAASTRRPQSPYVLLRTSSHDEYEPPASLPKEEKSINKASGMPAGSPSWSLLGRGHRAATSTDKIRPSSSSNSVSSAKQAVGVRPVRLPELSPATQESLGYPALPLHTSSASGISTSTNNESSGDASVNNPPASSGGVSDAFTSTSTTTTATTRSAQTSPMQPVLVPTSTAVEPHVRFSPPTDAKPTVVATSTNDDSSRQVQVAVAVGSSNSNTGGTQQQQQQPLPSPSQDYKQLVIERLSRMSNEAAAKFLGELNNQQQHAKGGGGVSPSNNGGFGRGAELLADDDAKSVTGSASCGEPSSSSSIWRNNTMASAASGSSIFGAKGRLSAGDGTFKPFTSQLALKSFQLTSHEETVVRPVTIDAAVLFVDMTGYSKVAKALESKGAFALFDTVNGYLTKIIDVIVQYGGEVVKFAGDAILCLWYGSKKNACRAAHCALDLQEHCREYPVEDTDLSLKLHIGLVAGEIVSSVFTSSSVKNMENNFHLIKGDCLSVIGDVVDTAKAGEICIARSAVEFLCSDNTFACAVKDEAFPDILLLEAAPGKHAMSPTSATRVSDDDTLNTPTFSNSTRAMCDCIPSSIRKAAAGHALSKSSSRRPSLTGSLPKNTPTNNAGASCASSNLLPSIPSDPSGFRDDQNLDGFEDTSSSSDSEVDEEETCEEDVEHRGENMQGFINPGVRRKLRQGLLQSQMAEMRLLTILFIHKTDVDIDADDWFAEVQMVLDGYRCPILQVIDDDKGVHLVAAINLFFADREPAVTGLRLAKALVERKSGCTVGMACDVTFCGVVGSSKACRWDVTGAACVRACRLMQHGIKTNEPVVIGQSVLHYAQDDSLTLPMGETVLKGSPEPVKLFKLADVDTRILSAITSAMRSSSAIHVPQFKIIQRDVVKRPKMLQRHGIIVHGPAGSGKSYLCVRSVFQTGFIAIMHVAVENSRQLDLVQTICTWFRSHKDPAIHELATQALDALQLEHNIRALSLVLRLIDCTIKMGLKSAFIVRQAQCLDHMSSSFIRQVVTRPKTEGTGRVLFFGTVIPQNGLPSWFSVMTQFGGKSKCLPLEVGRLDNFEGSSLIEHRFGWRCDKALEDAIVEISGNVAGCIDATIDYLTRAEPPMVFVSRTGIVHATAESLRKIQNIPWTQISPSVCAKSAQLVDALPTSAKTLLKVIAVLHTKFFPIHKSFATAVTTQLLTTVMPDKVNKDIATLLDLSILGTVKAHLNLERHAPTMIGMHDDDDEDDEATGGGSGIALVFQSPAILDVVKSITLPVQFQQVSQFAAKELDNYTLHAPHHFFAKAHFLQIAGEEQASRENWGRGAEQLRQLRSEQPLSIQLRNLEDTMVEQLLAFGMSLEDIEKSTHLELSDGVASPLLGVPLLPPHIVAIKDTIPPLSLGALTHCLRQTALCIRTLCVDAGAGVTTPSSYLVEVRDFVTTYCTFVKHIDAKVGFMIEDHLDLSCFDGECALMLSWIRNADYETVCGFGHSYREYMETVVAPREKAVHAYVEANLDVPARPSHKPLWEGAERESLEQAMSNCIEKWRSGDHVSAIRDGLMELATQGWVPQNPDMTLEFQRDCYLRKRNLPIFCFVSFLFVNLSLSWA